jgi:hypothetical protein
MTEQSPNDKTQPFNQFNFNFEILKLVEELAKKAFSDSSIRTKIAQNKVAELWDSVEREMLRQLAVEDEAERKRYDI